MASGEHGHLGPGGLLETYAWPAFSHRDSPRNSHLCFLVAVLHCHRLLLAGEAVVCHHRGRSVPFGVPVALAESGPPGCSLWRAQATRQEGYLAVTCWPWSAAPGIHSLSCYARHGTVHWWGLVTLLQTIGDRRPSHCPQRAGISEKQGVCGHFRVCS